MSPPVISRTRLLLKALNYPKLSDFNPEDRISYRQCVAWLENQKIRQLKVAERGPLTDVNSDAWLSVSYPKYLAEVNYPHQFSPATQLHALEWLAALAAHLDYSDNADKYNTKPRPAGPKPDSASVEPSSSQPFNDLSSADVQAGLHQLCELLHVPHAIASGEQLQGAVKVLPAAAAAAAAAHAQGASLPDTTQALNAVPLGLHIKDPGLGRAATVLRLLYILDLRELQSAIDRAIIEMQEYTANPKTDAGLGRVGR